MMTSLRLLVAIAAFAAVAACTSMPCPIHGEGSFVIGNNTPDAEVP